MKNAVYYFSGTGSTLAVAKAIAKRLGDCELIDVARIGGGAVVRTSATERVGFAFPIYFLGLPAIAHSFLRRVTVEGSPYVFSVITAGGDSASVGNLQIESILARKGLVLAAGFRVTMPDNYYVFYDADAKDKAKAVLAEAEGIIERIAESVKAKATDIEGPSHWYERALARPVNALFRLRVHGAGRHFRVSPDCTGCGRCARACGIGNISIQSGKPLWDSSCEQCFGCINACPVQAISYRTSRKVISQYLHPDYATLRP
jgi:ferredoxin